MTTTTDAILSMVPLLVIAATAWWLGHRAWTSHAASRVTVRENQSGVRFSRGAIEAILPTGDYSTWLTRDHIVLVDRFDKSLTIAGQEMLTADNLPVRVSLVVVYAIVDPRKYVLAGPYPENRLYEIVQVSQRAIVASQAMEPLLAERTLSIAGMKEAVAASLAEIGIEIRSIDLRDFTLSGAAKQAYADIWKAQKEGVAALERARGEQAALRALNNSARMLKNNPELMNLRLLQALHGAPGATAPTVILGGGPGLATLQSGGSPPEPDDA